MRRLALSLALASACSDDLAGTTSPATTSTSTGALETDGNSDTSDPGLPTDIGAPVITTTGETPTSTTSTSVTTTADVPPFDCTVNKFSAPDSDSDGLRDTHITTQTDLGALTGCTDLDGSLYLKSNDITDLSPLASLRRIGGAFHIDGESETEDPGGLLSLGGLGSLESVARLRIVYTSITDLQPLAGLTVVPGYVFIAANRRLTTLEGLHNLEHIGADLTIANSEHITDLTGLRGLHSIGADLYLTVLGAANLHGLESLTEVGSPGGDPVFIGINLQNLTTMEHLAIQWHDAHSLGIFGAHITDLAPLAGVQALHSLQVYEAPELTDLSALAALTTVHDLLAFTNTPALADLGPLANLQSVGGLTLEGTALTDFGPLPGLTTPGTIRLADNTKLVNLSALAGRSELDALSLEHNPKLATLTDLSSLTHVAADLELRDNDTFDNFTDVPALTTIGGRLVITFNSNLAQSDAEAWGAGITVGEDRKIAGNKGDPDPQLDPCPWTGDGECDETGVELLCAENSDNSDCVPS